MKAIFRVVQCQINTHQLLYLIKLKAHLDVTQRLTDVILTHDVTDALDVGQIGAETQEGFQRHGVAKVVGLWVGGFQKDLKEKLK